MKKSRSFEVLNRIFGAKHSISFHSLGHIMTHISYLRFEILEFYLIHPSKNIMHISAIQAQNAEHIARMKFAFVSL